MRQDRFPVIDGDGHITERSKEILELLGDNYRGNSKDESWADAFSPFPDYPHERQRGQYLEDISGIETRSDIAESAKRRIPADNARTFYRLAD